MFNRIRDKILNHHTPITLVLFAICFTLLTSINLTQQNVIGDESVYILEGDTYLHKKDSFYNNSGSPRFLKLLTGTALFPLSLNRDYSPYYLNTITDVVASSKFIYEQNSSFSKQIITLARIPHFLIGLSLGLAIYLYSKYIFGIKVATFALVFYAFNSTILAHSATANLDIGTTAFMFFTLSFLHIYAITKFTSQKKHWSATALLGVLLGITQTTKISAVLLYLIFVIAFIVIQHKNRFAHLAAIFITSLFSIWAVYSFQIGPFLLPSEDSAGILAMVNVIPGVEAHNVWIAQTLRLPIFPAGAYLNNFTYQLTHNFYGQSYYLLGELSDKGWWYFTPAIMFIKNSIIFVTALLIGLLLIALNKKLSIHAKIILVLWPILLFAWTVNSRLQLGVRYLMPMYPSLIIVAAYAISKIKFGKIVLFGSKVYVLPILIMATYAFSNIKSYPNFFSYISEPYSGSNQLDLVYDSDYDWGQNIYKVSKFQKKHNLEPIYFRGFGGANYEKLGIINSSDPVYAFNNKLSGFYAFSHTTFINMRVENPKLYTYFYSEKPYLVIGKNIYVYKSDF
ncbi:MAG: glycosyltransferase family 39 protein [bacterium]|nr:glycosyltransferase family 39 protein [bacterium]